MQAKKLTFTAAAKPKVDWRHSKGRQYSDLMDTARDLGVPALYAVYFGGLGYRANWPCEEDPPGCEDCAGLTINMVPLLTYSSSPTPTDAADLACTYGTPLEKLSGIKTWWRSLPFAGTPLADVRSGRAPAIGGSGRCAAGLPGGRVGRPGLGSWPIAGGPQAGYDLEPYRGIPSHRSPKIGTSPTIKG